MNRAILCVGAYASNPFYVDKVFVNVYSLEELNFVLYENAFLMDKEILNRLLAEWIDKELKLQDLAKDLYTLLNQDSSAAAMVGTILSYTGYYSEADIERVESILRMNVSMNAFEKWKAKADFLVENRHFVLALSEYRKLLDALPEEESDLRARVYNNMGVVYMGLYLSDSAEQCFLSSYEIDNNEEAYRQYLLVKRLSLDDEEYIKLIAEHEDAYRLSIQLESEMEEERRSFDETDEAKSLLELFQKKNVDGQAYYEEMLRYTESLKEDYRDIVLDYERKDTNTENMK